MNRARYLFHANPRAKTSRLGSFLYGLSLSMASVRRFAADKRMLRLSIPIKVVVVTGLAYVAVWGIGFALDRLSYAVARLRAVRLSDRPGFGCDGLGDPLFRLATPSTCSAHMLRLTPQ